jgi:hypothetical protein
MNLDDLISCDKVLNFVMGDKDGECTYKLKEYAVRKFLITGEQFIYLKRHKSDLKTLNNYFDEIALTFPNHEFKVKGHTFMIDGNIAGWAIPLSRWQNEKSVSYPFVTTIIYDGFIYKGNVFGRYLPKESSSLLNFMDTVIRTRDNVTCFCVDSTNEIVNPYFIYFNIVPSLNKKMNVYKDIAIEFYDTQDTKEMNFTEQFINKDDNELDFLFKIFDGKEWFGCWYDVIDHSLLISRDYVTKSKRFINIKSSDLTERIIGIKKYLKVFNIDIILDLFKQGNVNFSNEDVRDSFYSIFKTMLR